MSEGVIVELHETMTLKSIVTASTSQVSSNLGEEVVILHLQSGVYYGLDEVGASVWNLLHEPVQVAAICDAIMREYEVSAEQCERDVVELLQDLANMGLVHVTPASDR